MKIQNKTFCDKCGTNKALKKITTLEGQYIGDLCKKCLIQEKKRYKNE